MRTQQQGTVSNGGMVTTALAALVSGAPLALLGIQDWYVDASAPGCPGGSGSQADPFCAIQVAVDAAVDGDTIHIAPGRYFENVVIAEDLTLIGIGGQAVTIVDGGALDSVVRVDGDQSTVDLIGITLTNGLGYGGGGLACHNANNFEPGTAVHLYDCSVVGNQAQFGGGIFASNATTVTLTRTKVCDNVADGASGQGEGGAIAVAGNPGGVWLAPAVITLTACTVSGNTAMGQTAVGGGIAGGNGSAMTIQDSIIRDNRAVGPDVQGGAIWGFGAGIVLRNSTLTRNTAAGSSSAWGGAVINGYGSLTISDSTLSQNSAPSPSSYGDGLLLYGDGSGVYGDDLTITNSIVWDNGAAPIVLLGTPSTLVHHSLVEGGWPGAGNLDEDPLFTDPWNGDFRLLPGSPCIDRGDNRAVPFGLWTDLGGKRRFIDGSGAGLAWHKWPFVDLGAHEFGEDPPPKVRQH